MSGMMRPESRLTTGTMEQMLRTSRTSRTSRPISATTARQARLGTATMLAQRDAGQFLNLARLNVAKYAEDDMLNRHVFDYVFYHEADMKIAYQIAAVATKAAKYKDWYWKNQLGNFYSNFVREIKGKLCGNNSIFIGIFRAFVEHFGLILAV